MDGQGGWRFCDACYMVFWAGWYDTKNKQPIRGACPARGKAGHSPQGFVFYLPHDKPATFGQQGWAYCKKCLGLFWVGNPGQPPLAGGKCAADGGLHDGSSTFPFVIPFNNPDVGQPDWAFCKNCHTMFYDVPTNAGKCPATKEGHDGTGSLKLDLPHRPFPEPSVKVLHTAGNTNAVAQGTGLEPSALVEIIFSWKSPTDFEQFDPFSHTTDFEGGLYVAVSDLDPNLKVDPSATLVTVSIFDSMSGETRTDEWQI